ncbi:hypothetical protein [Streptomyces sp. MBT33]|uniref:hypothetical protein n=1 Tax=Streptomyces sp. MBT33 TaxID=1488363 RepID=UPI0019096470|nr:hypothetical protein [Streptomyces sp. MBT33]MBK3646394.1 hypothetical protein [Streptomyces sp. MBT33]
MTKSGESKRSTNARKAFRRRLARQTALGAAGAAGTGLVTLILRWLGEHMSG